MTPSQCIIMSQLALLDALCGVSKKITAKVDTNTEWRSATCLDLLEAEHANALFSRTPSSPWRMKMMGYCEQPSMLDLPRTLYWRSVPAAESYQQNWNHRRTLLKHRSQKPALSLPRLNLEANLGAIVCQSHDLFRLQECFRSSYVSWRYQIKSVGKRSHGFKTKGVLLNWWVTVPTCSIWYEVPRHSHKHQNCNYTVLFTVWRDVLAILGIAIARAWLSPVMKDEVGQAGCTRHVCNISTVVANGPKLLWE